MLYRTLNARENAAPRAESLVRRVSLKKGLQEVVLDVSNTVVEPCQTTRHGMAIFYEYLARDCIPIKRSIGGIVIETDDDGARYRRMASNYRFRADHTSPTVTFLLTIPEFEEIFR